MGTEDKGKQQGETEFPYKNCSPSYKIIQLKIDITNYK